MRLKTFVADNMQSALASVRAELGPEAIIIGSEKTKSGGLLVRAALEEPDADARGEAAAAQIDDGVRAIEADEPVEAPTSFEEKYRDGLIRRLRGDAPAGKPVNRSFNRAGLLALLRAHRAPDALAHALAEAAEKCRLGDMTLALASALDGRMKSMPLDLGKASCLLLAGLHGTGKSAVAAKIAAHARMIGRDVTLIAADSEGAGAVSRLQTFAEHLGAKLAVADSADALMKAFSESAQDNALAIADTAGFDPRNGKARTAFAAIARTEGLDTIAVTSATADAEETGETIAALKSAGAGRLIVSSVDLARRLGALMAAGCAGLPLAHVTRSPFVAGGLETLTPLSLARALIESQSLNPDRGSAQ